MSKKNDNNPKKQNKKLLTSLLVLLAVLAIAVIGIIFFMENKDKKEENKLAYTDLIREISSGNIEEVEMTTGSTTVKVKLKNEDEEKTAIVPDTEAFITLVQDKVAEGNDIKLNQKPRSIFAQIPSIIISLLPTAIMVALFVMIFNLCRKAWVLHTPHGFLNQFLC